MKNITEFKPSQVIGIEQSREQVSSIDSQAEYCMNVVLKELRAICPAWRNAIKNQKELDDVKRIWTKAFMENGIVSMAAVQKGLVVARKNQSNFFPSVGVFIGWCQENDFTECFNRFMSKEKPRNQFERLVFTDAVHANVRLKAVGDDEKTFKKVFDGWVKRFAAGDIPQDVPALPQKSVVMPSDIVREKAGRPDPKKFRKGSIFNRIAQLGQGG